jgi:hypothetical protein
MLYEDNIDSLQKTHSYYIVIHSSAFVILLQLHRCTEEAEGRVSGDSGARYWSTMLLMTIAEYGIRKRIHLMDAKRHL